VSELPRVKKARQRRRLRRLLAVLAAALLLFLLQCPPEEVGPTQPIEVGDARPEAKKAAPPPRRASPALDGERQAESGVVSEQQLEPVGATEGLNEQQLTCLMTVLSTPPYKLASPASDTESMALLPRVGMVIEF